MTLGPQHLLHPSRTSDAVIQDPKAGKSTHQRSLRGTQSYPSLPAQVAVTYLPKPQAPPTTVSPNTHIPWGTSPTCFLSTGLMLASEGVLPCLAIQRGAPPSSAFEELQADQNQYSVASWTQACGISGSCRRLQAPCHPWRATEQLFLSTAPYTHGRQGGRKLRATDFTSYQLCLLGQIT